MKYLLFPVLAFSALLSGFPAGAEMLVEAGVPAAVSVQREGWLEVADAVEVANIQSLAGAADPLTTPMGLCEQRGCTAFAFQRLGEEEGEQLRALFALSRNAEDERLSIGRAIALLERFMGARNGTWRDRAANEREGEDEPGQLDCIAESINTRTYLDRLALAGLMRFHVRGDFIHRYTVVLQHVALEIVPIDGERRFAVDSWVGANGEEPEIVPYDQWRWEWGV